MPAPTQERFIVIFDNAPLEDAPWIQRACTLSGLKFISNDPVTTELGKDKEAREVMAKRPLPFGAYPPIGPYFAKALEKVIAEKAAYHHRFALHGVNWLIYGQKAACAILDFDPVYAEAEKGRQAKMPEHEIQQYVSMFTKQTEENAKKYLGPERVLVLPKGASDANKAELSFAHVRKFDVK